MEESNESKREDEERSAVTPKNVIQQDAQPVEQLMVAEVFTQLEFLIH